MNEDYSVSCKMQGICDGLLQNNMTVEDKQF